MAPVPGALAIVDCGLLVHDERCPVCRKGNPTFNFFFLVSTFFPNTSLGIPVELHIFVINILLLGFHSLKLFMAFLGVDGGVFQNLARYFAMSLFFLMYFFFGSGGEGRGEEQIGEKVGDSAEGEIVGWQTEGGDGGVTRRRSCGGGEGVFLHFTDYKIKLNLLFFFTS